MSNPNKAKGTRWEVSVASFLRERGFTEVFRLAPAGEYDAGDIGGLPKFALECRDRQSFNLAENVKDANNRAKHKVCPFGVAVLKKRGASVEQGYVVMDLDTFARILHELRGGTNL
jgi:hypothetical protein